MDIKIKAFDELSLNELYEILKLRSEVFVVEQQCIYQDIDDFDQQSFHLFASIENQLVAYIRVLPDGLKYDCYSAIGRVLVKNEFRKNGYGIILMNEAIDFCKQNFSFPIKISAQAYLEKFYQSLGFKIVSEPYLEDNIPHISMVRH